MARGLAFAAFDGPGQGIVSADDRVRAVVPISGWYTPVRRFARMEPLTRAGQYQHLGPDPAAAMDAITLAGVAGRAKVPLLLQVFGGLDRESPPSHGQRIAAEHGGPVKTVVYPDRAVSPGLPGRFHELVEHGVELPEPYRQMTLTVLEVG